MHICWLAGHFIEEYTASEYACRGANASFSWISPFASRRKTVPTSAASASARPRTRTDPCSTTAARRASRCSAAQVGTSPADWTHSMGGLPGCRSISSGGAPDRVVISVPLVAGSQGSHQLGGAQHGQGGLGRPGAQEVVAAVGELVQGDVVGQQGP